MIALAVSLFVATTCSWPALASVGSPHLALIKSTIGSVKFAPTLGAQRRAAERLAELVRTDNGKKSIAIVVPSIAGLLDIPDDLVRHWIGIALGNIGSPAKSAIPKLEKVLPTVDCMNGPITGAGGIRYALLKLGVKPPFPQTKCKNRTSG